MTAEENRRFDELIEKVVAVDSLRDLSPRDRADYERLADLAQYEDQIARRENFGF